MDMREALTPGAWQSLADESPGEYYEGTPFMRSVWEGRLPTWLGQAYDQDIRPAFNALPDPTTMSGALAYAKAPYTIGRAMLTGASDTIRAARADPTNAKKALDLALMTAGIGGAASRAFGGINARRGSTVLGANVFHGGPHKYGPEGAAKSLDHINTGEGAQAYGWGRYDAGSPEVAKQYQMRVPAQDTKRTFLHALPEDASIEDVVDLLGKGHFSESQETLIRALQADDWLGFDYPSQAISAAYSKNLDNWNPSAALRSAVDDSGKLYKHDLPDEDIARYLDWDAPLSEQPEGVRKAFQKAFEDAGIPDAAKMNPDGESAYTWLAAAQSRGESVSDAVLKQRASEALGRAGIPGLKYYDQMSRAPVKDTKYLNRLQTSLGNAERAGRTADAATIKEMIRDLQKEVPNPTRNYVTWDQDVLNRMKLLERDGETFAMGGSPLAAAPLALEQQRPALTPEMLQALLADPNGA